jgi:hypothetical protein
MQSPPLVVAFDVIETLFPLEPLRPKLETCTVRRQSVSNHSSWR